jgi:hypothetical protein
MDKISKIPFSCQKEPFPSDLQSCAIFLDWVESSSRIANVSEIELLSIDHFSPAHIGFVHFRNQNTDILLRSGSVAIVVLLISEETGEKFTVLTEQLKFHLEK